MRKRCLAFIALAAFCVNAGAVRNPQRIGGSVIAAGSNLAGVVTDAETGKGIEGVPVSDGYSYALTDANGVYQLEANPLWRTVQCTVPADYAMPQHEDGSPAFFAYRDGFTSADPSCPVAGEVAPQGSDGVERHDFTLTRLAAPEEELTFVLMSDPQCQNDGDVARFRSEVLPDIRKVLDGGIEAGEYRNVYAIGLGDVIFDNQEMWMPMHDVFRSIELSDRKVPIFNIPGNHDHSNIESNDYDALRSYVRFIGPANYSFDRGKVHVICVDGMVYSHSNWHTGKGFKSCSYDAGYTPDQLEWLRQDISLVRDKEDKLVIFVTHGPFRGGAESGGANINYDKGYDEVLRLLTEFHDARIMIGHTHYPENWRHDGYICKSGRPVLEHVHHATCGAWWHSTVCVDGAPLGYGIYQVRGNVVEEGIARYCGFEEGHQMRVYDGNQSYTGSKGLEYKWEDRFSGCFVATVWNDDEYNWSLDLVASDGTVYPMRRVQEPQRDWLVYAFYVNEAGISPKSKTYQHGCRHFWYVPAPCGRPSEERGWTIRATQTAPASGVVRVYTCGELQTDFSGLYAPEAK